MHSWMCPLQSETSPLSPRSKESVKDEGHMHEALERVDVSA